MNTDQQDLKCDSERKETNVSGLQQCKPEAGPASEAGAESEGPPAQAASLSPPEADHIFEEGLDDLPWGSPARGQSSPSEEAYEEAAVPEKKPRRKCLIS